MIRGTGPSRRLARIRDWIGGGGEGEQELSEWRKTRLARLLQTTAQKLAEQWEQSITTETFALMQNPAARVAIAEHALTHIQQELANAIEAQRPALDQQSLKVAQAWQQVESAVQECLTGGGFRWFGGRSRTRQLRIFMDRLSAFVHLRLDEELLGALVSAWSTSRGDLPSGRVISVSAGSGCVTCNNRSKAVLRIPPRR